MMTMNKSWHLMLAAIAAFCAFDAFAGIVYVSATSGDDSNDGSRWALAKQTIQAGVDAAASNDTVLVTNGTYNLGGRIPPGQVLCKTRVVVDKAVSVISVNGPSNTFIVGQGPRGDNAIRCVWMTNAASLSGFTLTNGCTTIGASENDDDGGGIFALEESAFASNCIFRSCQARVGGGAYNCTLYNSILSDNVASFGGGTGNCFLKHCTLINNTADVYYGGAAYCGTLNECIMIGNYAHEYGGGAYNSTMNNCIMTGNDAGYWGGGAYASHLNNCMLSGNTAGWGGGAHSCFLNNCTAYGNTNCGIINGTARNTISFGNTEYEMDNVSASYCYTNNPLFVDPAGGNLRLQTNSPCINVGYNAFAPTNVTPFDIDGNPRISQLTVDIGAYEFQGIAFFDIFASAGLNGSITPSGIIRTNQGADVSFVIHPDMYFHVQNVLTNGVSVGGVTDFTWHDISASGTVTVSFAATLAAHGTPHWWLAQWGWTNDFDSVEAMDQDGDDIFTWEEYPHNTCPTNSNTDGDQFDDGVEVNAGADPLQDDSRTYGAMQAHPASFNLYTSNSVLDLSFGEMMVQMVSNNIQVRLTMQSTDLLDGDGWTNVGNAVEWECPADLNKSFFRFLGTPVE